jgi:hypothetical protein
MSGGRRFNKRRRRRFSWYASVRVRMLTYFKAIRPKSGYSVDEAFTGKPHTAELFATVRDNGRISG